MAKELKMKTVKVGVVYQSIGYINVEVPAKLRSKKAIFEHLEKTQDDLPLPEDPDYLEGSYEIDSIDGICKEEIKW